MEYKWKVGPNAFKTPTKAINIPGKRGYPKSEHYIIDKICCLSFMNPRKFKPESFIVDIDTLYDMVETNEQMMLDCGILDCLQGFLQVMNIEKYHYEATQIIDLLKELCKCDVFEKEFYNRREILKALFNLIHCNSQDVIISYMDLLEFMIAHAFKNFSKDPTHIPAWFTCFIEDEAVFLTFSKIIIKSKSKDVVSSALALMADFGRLFISLLDNEDRKAFIKMFFTCDMVIGFYDGFMMVFPKILEMRLLPEKEMDYEMQLKVIESFIYMFETFLTLEYEGYQDMNTMKIEYFDVFDSIKSICQRNYFGYIKAFYGHILEHIDNILDVKTWNSFSDYSGGSRGSSSDFDAFY